MASITTRTGKGSPLTHVEVDNNFTNLNTAKLEAGAIALGSAGTPSISFTGDTNTGIFSNGADQLSITTAGVQRFKVGPNGHVALGEGSTITDFNFLNIQGSNLTHTVGVVLNKTDATAQIWAMRNTGPLTFYNYTANTAALTITTGGLVGIGSSSPSVRLQVQDSIAGGSDNTIATLHNFSDTGGDTRYAGLNFRIGSDNGTSAIRAFRTNTATNYETNLSFWTNPTGATQTPLRAMTIDSSQRVGIGTTSPAAKLDVAGSHATNLPLLFLRNTSATNTATTLSFYSYINYNGGITGAGSEISAETTFATDTGTSQMVFKTTSNITYLGPQEKMRLDASGRLLVGTSTSSGPGSTLQVRNDDSAAAMDIFRSAATTGTSIFGLNKSRGTAATPLEVADNDVLGYIAFRGYDGTTYQDAAYIHAECDGTWTDGGDTSDNPGALVFSTTADGAASPTERMRIKADGDVSIVTGNLIIGTSGKGIDFSADGQAAGMTSELLDDYEEGTWTPTCNAGAALTLTGSPQYTKIGRQVTVHAEFAVSSNADGTQFQISGLPFASNNSTGNSAAVSMGYFATDLAAYLTSNATTITFQNLAASANKTNANLSGAYLIIACTYFTA